MDIKNKIKHIEDCRKAFEIEVASAEVKARLKACVEKISKIASIPGFRAGKAPLDLVEKHYGDRATREVIEELVSDSYYKALEESGLIPLGLPQISDVNLNDEKALSFKAEFNIRPKIELKDYKGLKLSKKKIDIKEEAIDKSIKSLQESNAKFKNVQDRPVKIGDYIVCDSEIFIDDKSIAKKRENVWMPVEEKSYIPNVSNSLVGAKPGDEKAIETTMPEDFANKEYANKKAIFKIKINEIKEKQLSGIDDAFAKDMGYADIPELRKAMKALLESQIERQQRQEMENQIVEILLGLTTFDVPSPLVEKQAGYLLEEEKKRLSQQGIKEADIKEKEKELADKVKPWAQKQVKAMFILDEIGSREGITVSKEELDEAIDEISRQYSQPKEKVAKYYEENDMIPGLKADILHAKIFSMLIKEAKIEEIAEK